MNQLVEIRKGDSTGEMVTTTVAIALGTENDHASVIKLVRTYQEDLEDFGRVGFEIQSFPTAGGMQSREVASLNEQQATLLLTYMRNSEIVRRFKKTLVKAFYEARSATPAAKPEKLPGELAILECYTRLLNPAPSARIAMLKQVGKKHELDVSFLPGYAVDAAPDADGSGSMPTSSLTALLKRHDIKLSASVYNTILRDLGVLEMRTRKTSKGEDKSFWVITDKGQRFGKNLTSPASPRETQPHWYTERFSELHGIVSARMGRAA